MIDKAYQNCTRVLTLNDLDAVIDVLDEKTKISKIDKNQLADIKEQIIVGLSNKNYRLIGYFESNVLVSFLVQVISTKISAWHMIMLATKSVHHWNYKKNGLEYCWANAMDYAEQLGIYKVYWSLPSSWARTQRRTYQTTDVWHRYDIYIDDVIEENNFPKWEDHKISFGKVAKPHQVTVKMAVLKNEFRRFNTEI